ncbi:hypothetical protein [Thalassoglobus neptunius]|nr:hypothetical protein [Thalassoglobus neptunius]
MKTTQPAEQPTQTTPLMIPSKHKNRATTNESLAYQIVPTLARRAV